MIDAKTHPLVNPESTHYQMVGGVESIEYMEAIFSTEELMAWAKLTAMSYRMRIGKKDDVVKEAHKIKTFEAYYEYLKAKMLSKENQLRKSKKPNPRKMTKVEYELYVDFVNEKAKGMCQCGCGRKADDIHHSMRGINKDDRSIIAICKTCHNLIHSCGYKEIEEASRLALLSKNIGKINFKDYVL